MANIEIRLPSWVPAELVGRAAALCAGARRSAPGEPERSRCVEAPADSDGAGAGWTMVEFVDASGSRRSARLWAGREGSQGRQVLTPRSTAFWVATGQRLGKLFGGCVEVPGKKGRASFETSPEQARLREEDFAPGAPAGRAELAMASIAPLSREELEAADALAVHATPLRERDASWMPFESAREAHAIRMLLSEQPSQERRGSRSL